MTSPNPHADCILTIDLSAIVHNWRVIAAQAGGAQTAAVVKANAYGLGVDRVAPALYDAGCREFFVATLDEGIQLRALLQDDAHIAVLNGVRAGQAAVFTQHALTPILNTLEEYQLWHHHAHDTAAQPAILHFDTGMNRLGVSADEAAHIARHQAKFGTLNWRYIMSHLACSDMADHPMNAEQREELNHLRTLFDGVPCSMANSTAGLNDAAMRFDLIRPGIHLFGSTAGLADDVDIRPVITLTAPIIQLRHIAAAGTVGYGATYTVRAGDRVGVLPIGYADGYLRHLSNRGQVAFGDTLLPVAGRVSMDLTTIDITTAPSLSTGDRVDIIGPAMPLDVVAENASTIAYEILTNLSPRYRRLYKN